jgi:hypothetical protein
MGALTGTCAGCGRADRKLRTKSRMLCAGCDARYLKDPSNYRAPRTTGGVTVCIVDGCDRPTHKRRYCDAHAKRVSDFGDPLSDVPVASRTGVRVVQFGDERFYRMVRRPEHELAGADGYVLEHRLVAWEAGLLTAANLDHHVHHINRDGLDNRLENLQVMTAGDHARLHAKQDGTINQYGHWRTS